jgi:peptidyl-prolyl cis-trans isomerase NIMA-interacting 1
MCPPRTTASRALGALAAIGLLALPACDKGSSGGGAGASPAPSATDAGERLAWPPPPDTATDAPVDAPPPAEVIVQHILVTYRGAKRVSGGITRTREEAKARAEEALKKARAGEDFTQLVYEYSDDPEARSRMGSLGKIRRGDMTKPFEDAAFALKVGEISDVVETRFGFHVIKRNQ